MTPVKAKQKIVLSTHLMVVTAGASDRAVVHRWTGAALPATSDLLEFLDFFKAPHTMEDLRRNYRVDQVEEKIQRLMELLFLLDADTDEEMRWLGENVGIELQSIFHSDHFTIFHPGDTARPVRSLAALLEKAYGMLTVRGLGRLRRPSIVFICRTEQEFQRLWGNNSFPAGLRFFVTKGRILAIAPTCMLSADLCSEHFFRTMIHELVHIFLCQRFTQLPVWAVEGLCEYFSQPDCPMMLRRLMTSKGLLSFEEIEQKAVHSLLDIDAAPAAYNIAYRQAHSFITFLARSYGEKRLMECIFDSGLSKEFKKVFREYFSVSLAHMQALWRGIIDSGAGS